MLLKDIVSLTSALRVQKLNTTSDPIELDLEAGNLVLHKSGLTLYFDDLCLKEANTDEDKSDKIKATVQHFLLTSLLKLDN